MTTRKTITVTVQQDEWIKSQIVSGAYTNDSEYIRDLIRHDQERAQKIAAMQKLVDEGLASGISERSMDEILADAKARFSASNT
ncbi:MAG: type II toxin-antitoxin system ParD family antitoxin [Pseudomonadota bacterium]